METEDQPIPLDFVYAGRRILTGNKLGHAVFVIKSDGELEARERLYDLGGKFSAVVGGIYTGAYFSEAKSQSVRHATFKGSWPDAERKIDWAAEDRQTEIEMAARRLADNAKRRNEIDAIMLPLRQRVQAARKRGDFAMILALRQAVMASIDKPPTKDELK